MSDVLHPETTVELTRLLTAPGQVLPVGRMTKSALVSPSALPTASPTTLVSLAKLSGILDYEPAEFTFTAWAGTPIAEVQHELAGRNQYLPFDPLLVRAGATLGGTVAAGISGPGRVRYGGLRDFLLGVRLVCGDGTVVNTGGKVVKNAAGFDIPKLLVGSLGRFGVMTELTFKVFPQAPAMQTYRVRCDSDAAAMQSIAIAGSSRWELDAVDYRPADRSLFLRIGGPLSAITAIGQEIGERLGSAELLDATEASGLWQSIAEFDWAGAVETTVVAKVPITPTQFLSLRCRVAGQPGINLHLSAAGGLLWAAIDPECVAEFSEQLSALDLRGLVIRGGCESVWLGRSDETTMAAAIKTAMDPTGKFPGFGNTPANANSRALASP